MKLIAYIILGCLIIAAAQVTLAALALAIVLSLVWGLYARTSQTIGFLIVGGLTWLASAFPKTAFASGIVCVAYYLFRDANHPSDSQGPNPESGSASPCDDP